MATTTNYGWTTPDNTAYVKDGASAIRTLGSSVDTSLFNITGGKNVGMQYLTSSSVTAQSAVFINNIFSSTYDAYKIFFAGVGSASTAVSWNIDMANGGVRANLSTWGNHVIFANNTSANPLGSYTGGTTSAQAGLLGNSRSCMELTLYNPGTAVATGFASNAFELSTDFFIRQGTGVHTTTTAYDGIWFTAASGTFTGTFKVFGLRN